MRLACSGMVTRATEIPTTARRVSVASYCRTDDDEAKYNLGHKGCKASFYRHFAPLRTTETLLSITSLHLPFSNIEREIGMPTPFLQVLWL